jgi:pantoate--beta-alanine ligase
MDIIRSLDVMQQYSLGAKRRGLRIGLVPTMGCLHEGHLSLVKLARARSDVVVLSIYVNPIQFLPGEDFDRYPRPVERDEALCRETGVDIVFYPEETSMYSADHSVYVVEQSLSTGLCGSSRPGHFRGVTTIVAKLFNLVLPDVAVFGQKDAQQARIIQRMVRDLNYPTDIVLGPIVREVDGLALSSRNRYLSASERQDSVCLYHSLRRAENMVKNGERSVDRIRSAMVSTLSLSKSARIDYIEFVNDGTLQPVTVVEEPVLLALAVKIGVTRLIDNVVLKPT